MSDLEYVALAYGVIWLGLLGYLLRLSLRQEHLRREVRLLEHAGDAAGGGVADGRRRARALAERPLSSTCGVVGGPDGRP